MLCIIVVLVLIAAVVGMILLLCYYKDKLRKRVCMGWQGGGVMRGGEGEGEGGGRENMHNIVQSSTALPPLPPSSLSLSLSFSTLLPCQIPMGKRGISLHHAFSPRRSLLPPFRIIPGSVSDDDDSDDEGVRGGAGTGEGRGRGRQGQGRGGSGEGGSGRVRKGGYRGICEL